MDKIAEWLRKTKLELNAERRNGAAKQRQFHGNNPNYEHFMFERNWPRKLLNAARKQSRRKGSSRMLPVTIDGAFIEEMYASQKGLCHWLGIPMDKQIGSHFKVSIDRLDNSNGYVPGNIVLCTWFANRARGTMTVEEFGTVLVLLRKVRRAPGVPPKKQNPRRRIG